jgi:hypothetical protein
MLHVGVLMPALDVGSPAVGILGGVGRLEDTIAPSVNTFEILRRLALAERRQERLAARAEEQHEDGEQGGGVEVREGEDLSTQQR